MLSTQSTPADDQMRGLTGLGDAVRLLEQGSFEVLSLDIFDTLLWRAVPEPVDAFVLLGQHLLDLDRLKPEVSPHLFARLREGAEQKARGKAVERGRVPEITLSQIYDQLPAHLARKGSVADLEAIEVELEASITFPDLDVLALARWAKSQLGVRLALVSDTYFSEQQLRMLLDQDPLDEDEFDSVFASSQYGVGKGSGLFPIVTRSLDVAPGAVLHIGDNLAADVEAPPRHGMRAVHFEKLTGSLPGILEDEGLGRPDHRREVKPTLDPRWGDFGLTALRSKTLRRVAPRRGGGASDPYWRFGASVLGPSFVAFAEWIHARAEAEGVDTVYCMMREGEFLTRLVNGARLYLDSPVRARPIWLSRQVCARAAITEANGEELGRFLHRRVPPTVKQLCDSIGIGVEQLAEVCTRGDQRLDDPELVRRVLSHLSGDSMIRDTVVAGAAQLRTRLVDYVLSTVQHHDQPVVLVDLGWGGTIQAKLDRVLGLSGGALTTVGLYLLTNEGVLGRVLGGMHAEGFLGSGGLPPDAHWIIRNPEILEQVCMHDEGSLIDVSSDGEPILGPRDDTPTQTLQRTAVQAGILAFQEEWGRYRQLVPAPMRTLDGRARPQLTKMITRFIVRPTAEEVTLFSGWGHDQGFGSTEKEALVVPTAASALRHMTPRQLLELPMNKAYWTFALASLYSPPLAMAAAAIADGKLAAEALEPIQPCHVRLLIDSGAGFVEAVRQDAGPNPSGLSYVRFEVKARPIRAVMLGIGENPALLRVDWMRLVFGRQGRPEPSMVELKGPDGFPVTMLQRGLPLSNNVLLSHAEGPEVMYTCPPEWGSSVYTVEVEMAFAWMPLPPLPAPAAGNAEVLLQAARIVRHRVRRAWTSAGREANDRFRPPA
ncbi:MAG: hypothetical protein WKF86_00465 [Acidimicrobiales bacterium]